MLRIVLKDVLRSKKSLLVLACLISSIVIPFVLFLVSGSFTYAAKEENEKIYGSFDNIWYFADGTESVEQLNKYIASFGILEVLQTDYYNQEIFVGYMDTSAIDLANIYLLSGSWPSQDSELLVCNSLLYKNGYGYDVGAVLSINGKDYTVSGIINDYYSLWNKGNNQDTICFPNILIWESGEDSGMNILQKHLLLKNRIPFPKEVYSKNSHLIFNSNRIEYDTSRKYAIPSFVILLTSFCSALLSIYIFAYYIEKELPKLAIYRCLGLTQTEAFFYFAVKILILLVAAIPLGFILGYALSAASISIFNYFLGTESRLVFSFTYFALSALICIATTIVSLAISAYKFHRLPPLEQFKKHEDIRSSRHFNVVKTSKKITPLSLAWIELYTHRRKSASAILMISCSLALFSMLSLYMDIYNARVRDVPGRMPLTFDYEFLSDEKASGMSYIDSSGNLMQLNDILFDASVVHIPVHDTLFPNDILNDLCNNSEVNAVNTYYEVNDLYLESAPIETDNKYLSGYPFDGELSPLLKTFFSITSPTRGIQYFSYSEEDLLQMNSYVIAGEINIEKIRRGEEVILMAPMYELKELPGGYTEQSFLSLDDYDGKSNQYKDDAYTVGDTLDFIQINCVDKDFSGYVHESQIGRYLECNRYSVKIGAIIYQRIGWFDRMSQMPTAYTLIGLNQSIANLNLHPTTTRVQVFLKSTASYLKFNSLIQYCANELDDFSFRNNAAEMDGYKKYQLIISSICYVLNTITASVVIGISLLEEWIACQHNRKYYALLRINGLTNYGLQRIFLIRSVIITFGGLVGGTIIFYGLVVVMYGGLSAIVAYVNLYRISIIALLFTTVLTCMPFIINYYEKKKSIAFVLNND